MPSYFFDSSALVKRYVKEVGTAWVINLTDPKVANTIYIARITGVEVIAAIRKAERCRIITKVDADKIINDFRSDFSSQYFIIEMKADILTSAMDLADKYTLKGYDAVQLATAMMIDDQIKKTGLSAMLTVPSLTLVCSDKQLLAAASATSLSVEDPQLHP